MDKVIDSVNTPDGFFHDGNPVTGELGTIVEAVLMNAWQSAIKSMLREHGTILDAAGITPDNKSFNQLKSALDKLYATLNSPAFTGTPQAPTQLAGDNTTKLATTAFVQSAINALPKIDLTGYLKITDADNKYAFKSITVNGQPLSKNVNLTAGDVSAYTKTESDSKFALATRKINTKPLTADINLTAADVSAFTERPDLNASINLNTLCKPTDSGVYSNPSNSYATVANNYPVAQAGTLLVTKSAYGCQQMYITFQSNEVFVRGLTTSNNGSGPWGDWRQLSLSTHTHTIANVSNLQSILDSKVSVGVGQTWKNVSASRAMNVTYTNTTGKPIMISVTYSQAGESYWNIYVDNINISQARVPNVPSDQALVAIVPAGSTYAVKGTANNKNMWLELS